MSPVTNRNGSKNQTYINLTLTRPGDVVISYAGGLIKAIGLVKGSFRKAQKPLNTKNRRVLVECWMEGSHRLGAAGEANPPERPAGVDSPTYFRSIIYS